ncbi:unnamed protein product [Gordionus sp. m RMFG-2023]
MEEEEEIEVDEELDEEEEEELEEDGSRGKRKKPRFGGFILDEAEVDDEGEEEEDWEEGAEDLIDRRSISGESTARDAEGARRLAHMLNQKEDEIEEYYKRKYAEASHDDRYGEGDEQLSEDITHQGLLPGIKDPNLWMIKCRIGEEKATVVQLMRKFIAYQFTDEPLQITSVICKEGLKGYIYIESFKQSQVKQAIKGMGNLRAAQYQQKMVPINEMVDVLKVVKEIRSLKPKTWVRLRRGIYKDDIAQVNFVEHGQNIANLKLVPRIDYKRNRGVLRHLNTPNSTSDPTATNASKKSQWWNKIKKRPLSKLFDPDAIKAIGGEVSLDGDYYVFESNRYSKTGFLSKNFYISAIVVDGVVPTLTEMEKFEENADSLEDINIKSNKITEIHSFSAGDVVEVIEGDLLYLQGKVVTVDGSSITIMPNHAELKDLLNFQAHELKKFFKIGDHVKVLSGRFEGDTGLVVRVEENTVVLFSDLTMHEIKVLPKDLQLSQETTSGVDSLGQYQLRDLVHLDPQHVGVIVRIEKEIFQILNTAGKVVRVKPQSILRKKDTSKAVCLDSAENRLQAKDVIKICDGPHKGKEGTIEHIFRSFVFLHSKLHTESAGIFLCRARHLSLVGGSSKPMNRVDDPFGSLGHFVPMSPRISPSPQRNNDPFSQDSLSGSPTNAFHRRAGAHTTRDNSMIGQTVKIISGPYKGHMGIVKDSTETTSRVELHSNCQTINVDRVRIASITDKIISGGVTAYGRTPMMGGQTPMYGIGSKTPVYGSQTPQPDGSRTPHYAANMTPLHEGNRTPGNFAVPPMLSSNSSFTPSPSRYDHSASATPSLQIPDTPVAADRYDSPASSYTPYGAGPSPYPMTPGRSSENFLDWATNDLVVKIKESYHDSQLTGNIGILRGVSNNMCSLFLPDDEKTISILSHDLEPVLPNINDKVKVLCGEFRDMLGKLINIEGEDGVVKIVEEEEDIQLIPLHYLCKFQGTAND